MPDINIKVCLNTVRLIQFAVIVMNNTYHAGSVKKICVDNNESTMKEKESECVGVREMREIEREKEREIERESLFSQRTPFT